MDFLLKLHNFSVAVRRTQSGKFVQSRRHVPQGLNSSLMKTSPTSCTTYSQRWIWPVGPSGRSLSWCSASSSASSWECHFSTFSKSMEDWGLSTLLSLFKSSVPSVPSRHPPIQWLPSATFSKVWLTSRNLWLMVFHLRRATKRTAILRGPLLWAMRSWRWVCFAQVAYGWQIMQWCSSNGSTSPKHCAVLSSHSTCGRVPYGSLSMESTSKQW